MTLAGTRHAKTNLATVGEALHGEHFVNPLADNLGVSNRTMRRWLAGDDVPGGIWDDLAELIEQHQRRLDYARWLLNHDMRLATVERDDQMPF